MLNDHSNSRKRISLYIATAVLKPDLDVIEGRYAHHQ